MAIADVTARVNGAVKAHTTAAGASDAREAEIAAIEKESLAATKLRSDVVRLYRGGQYHLYRYKTYTDVRVVLRRNLTSLFSAVILTIFPIQNTRSI